MSECKAMVKELTSQQGRIVYDLKNPVDAQMAKFDTDGNGQFDYFEESAAAPRSRHGTRARALRSSHSRASLVWMRSTSSL